MALHTSTLILYKNSALEIDRNFMVDSITDYLATLSDPKTISSFQYIKHGLAINIKIDITQATLDYISANNYNYCSIKNDDGRLVYYYIVGKQWRGQSTIELNLQMDTINTFKLGTDYTLSKQSVVNREHKDRWTLIENLQYVYKGNADGLLSDFDTINIDFQVPHATEITSAQLFSYEVVDEDGQAMNLGWNDVDVIITNNRVVMTAYLSGTYGGHSASVSYSIVVVYKSYVRVIDKFPEGINPQLYKKDITQLYDKDNTENWYIIYKNTYDINQDSTTAEIVVNPVKILLCRDTEFSVNTTSLTPVRVDCVNIPKIPDRRENVMFSYGDLTASQRALGDSTFKINGNIWKLVQASDVDYATRKVYGISWTRINNTDVQGTIRFYGAPPLYPLLGHIDNVATIEITNYLVAFINTWRAYSNIDNSTLFNNVGDKTWNIGSGASSLSDTSATIKSVDLTEQQLIKVIALPYAPISELAGIKELYAIPQNLIWNSGYHMLEVATTNMFSFDYYKYFDDNPANKLRDVAPANTTGVARDKKYESKLLHSEFYYQKFVYGAYGFQFMLEYYDVNNPNIWDFCIEYAVSQSAQSKMLFKFASYITDGYDTQDYNDVLLVGMNNELPLYNNAYLNYIRSGQYNNDIKNMNNAKSMSWLGVGLGAIGTIASFVSAPFTGGLSIAGGIGMATSTFGQIAKTITSTEQNERNLEQKKRSLAYQGENVSSVEDIDLLEVYTENKPKMVEYKPSTTMENALYDLFFYCGYATREYKIPSFSGRKYFNFVMADIKYSSDTNLPEDIKEDIKNKYAVGITCLHKVSGAWDFAQQYENYETSLE